MTHRKIARAVVRLTNAGPNVYRSVYVDCAFMDAAGKAVQVGSALVSNLSPGEKAFGHADADASAVRIASVACRVDQTQP